VVVAVVAVMTMVHRCRERSSGDTEDHKEEECGPFHD
jgi:hypothetical protein